MKQPVCYCQATKATPLITATLVWEQVWGVFLCSCLQNVTYKYELKVSALKNVLIIPFDLLRTPKNLNFQNLGFIWSIGFFCYWGGFFQFSFKIMFKVLSVQKVGRCLGLWIAEGNKMSTAQLPTLSVPERWAEGCSSLPGAWGAMEEVTLYLKACGTRAVSLNFQFSPSIPSLLPFSSSSCNSLAFTSLPQHSKLLHLQHHRAAERTS